MDITDAKQFIKKMKLDMKKYKFTTRDLLQGMNVELEHKDITNGDAYLSGRIALAHLLEFPDYYKRITKMEKQATKYWSDKMKTKY